MSEMVHGPGSPSQAQSLGKGRGVRVLGQRLPQCMLPLASGTQLRIANDLPGPKGKTAWQLHPFSASFPSYESLTVVMGRGARNLMHDSFFLVLIAIRPAEGLSANPRQRELGLVSYTTQY